MKTQNIVMAAAVALLSAVALSGKAADPPAVYPSAIFPFQERGEGVKNYGAKVSDILFANLAADPNLILVERAEIQKLLDEHALNLSGVVAGTEATKVGQLTGAKIIVTGSVIEADKELFLVAKIIGTETSRVLGESIRGRTNEELGPLVKQLADKVATTIAKDAGKLVAKEVKLEDRLAALNKTLGNAKRPTVLIKVAERHVGQRTIDPAAQTELAIFCKETGFEVIDPDAGTSKQADLIILGEGFSEFAARHSNLISVKARLEVKVIDRATDKIIAVDRQTAVVVDLSEQLAGKAALQSAAATLAERLLPKLVKK